jgi:hypothetical protein
MRPPSRRDGPRHSFEVTWHGPQGSAGTRIWPGGVQRGLSPGQQILARIAATGCCAWSRKGARKAKIPLTRPLR